MRQVFTSPRLENVEAVARLLEDDGIEVRITNGRSYRGNRRRTFSYGGGADAGEQAAVWVIQSEDQVRAREILREAGLIDSTRHRDSFVASFREQDEAQVQADRRSQRIARIKYALLVGLLIAAGVMAVQMVRQRPQATDAPAALPVAPTPDRASEGFPAEPQAPFDGSAQPTILPVAEAVFAHELGQARLDIACLSIDGRDAPAALIQSLQAGLPADSALRLVSASNCVRNADEAEGSTHAASGLPALMVDVAWFRPTSADAGAVDFVAYHHRSFATYRTLELRRVDGRWQVERVSRDVSI
ncbi:hypothetical protein H4F99_02490 [Lysobacter sp. SG-8]|uniref:DUF2007 domain-containing protein n=1 Tax=Marilutibacter penaei TaxID=2759900 RepID=A0A7W3U1U0_9GAMM|nr:hypothetical protein [Lysobacter penaei]MBB1087354.1 hypothetical protein [Lysobacter penaei]